MLRFKRVIALLLLVATIGGVMSPTAIFGAVTVPAQVSFQLRPAGTLQNSIGDTVSLEIKGITAVNSNVAILYGGSSLGSVLLRTSDGGRRWQETMKFDDRSRVIWADFANSQVGWALSEDFWGESGGPITIHQTLDAGKTWQALSIVPTNSRYWSLVNVIIINSYHLEIDVYDAPDRQETPPQYFYRLTTTNGGKTWSSNRLLLSREELLKKYKNSGRILNYEQSTGVDRSDWVIKKGRYQLLVKHRLPRSKSSVVFSIPIEWRYRENKIVPR